MPAAFGFQSGSPLRARGNVLDSVAAEPEVRLLHVVDDDRDVLEPAVVAPCIGERRPPARCEVLGQFQALVSEPQRDDPRAGPEDPLQRSEEHTSELQSPCNLVCRLLLEKKKTTAN